MSHAQGIQEGALKGRDALRKKINTISESLNSCHHVTTQKGKHAMIEGIIQKPIFLIIYDI